MSQQQDSRGPATPRVFFALWPGASLQRRMDELATQEHQRCGGKKPRQENLHITLAFLGEQPVARIQQLQAIAATVQAAPFELVLDRIGGWRGNGITWLSAPSVPPALNSLLKQLQQGLKQAGFPTEDRPFVPHVTLLRKSRPAPTKRLDPPLVWPVNEFCLIQSELSEAGSVYTMIGRWPC